METDITNIVNGSIGKYAEVVDLIAGPDFIVVRRLRIERRYAKDDISHTGSFRVILIIE